MEVDEIRKAIKTPKSLHLNNVPHIVRDAFISLAEAKFGGNYSVTLSYLLEMTQAILPSLYDHEHRLSVLEKSPKIDPKEKLIKTIGGRIINRGGVNDE